MAGFVAASTDGGWVLSRSLNAATLFDLYRALDLPLAGDWLESQTEAPWQGRIAGAMHRAVAAEAAAMRLSIAALLDDTRSDEPAPLSRAGGQGRG